MALFEAKAKIRPGSQSNTKLTVSGHESPAESWVTDQNLPILFNYTYGGWAQKEVVIAKGVMVAVGPQIIDDEKGKLANTITIANGTNPVVGMAPYNITKHYPGFLTGNRPTIITEDYVELPWFPNPSDAEAVYWGLATGASLQAGDLLKPDVNGKLVKWVEGTDSIKQISAQILAFELDQEPFGWLRWALWDESALNEDRGPQSKSTFQLPPDSGFPFDPNFRDGLAGNGQNGEANPQSYWTPWTVDPTGIPGVLDGSQRALNVQNYTTSIAANTQPGTLVFNVGLQEIVDQTVQVYIGGVQQDPSTFTVDLKNGIVYYNLTSVPVSAQTVSIQFRANFYGTPAGWDFRGAVGAVRLLLKF
jgi:hypothetical protein